MNPPTGRHLFSLVTLIGVLAAASAPVRAEGGGGKIPTRDQIPEKYKWNIASIFTDLAAWQAEYARVEQMIDELSKLVGTLGNGPKALHKVLDLQDQVRVRTEKVYVYASLVHDQDTSVGEAQAMDARGSLLATKYGEATSWIEPELLAIPWETVQSWVEQDQRLGVYRHHLEDLFRQKKYVLSPREEELLAMGAEVRRTASNAYSMLKNADMVFPTIKDEQGDDVELNDARFYKLLRSADRRVRRDTYEGLVGTYLKYRNACAATLNGAVQTHIFNKKARGYNSCLEAALHGDNIPVAVYNNLIATVNQHLPLLHRYTSIRRKALNLEDGVRACDLFAPLTTAVRIEIPYDEAVSQILTALQPMGDEYTGVLKKGFDSRWIDVYSTRNKRSGAYSSGTYLTQPFILSNYSDGYEDMSTIAHEMGHSVHSWFSSKNQPPVYGDYSIFCAEVASTCNEILLQNYILRHTTDPQKKLYLLTEFLEGIRGTVFRQTMFSEFEQKIHEMAEAGQALTADSMSAAYRDIMIKYYGPDYVQDDTVDGYWIRIPHFYYNFYVFKYATSYCAAANIAGRIERGDPGAVDGYLRFLKAGSSVYPLEALKLAGVDMSTPKPIEDTMTHFDELLDQAEQLLKGGTGS